jgi:ATP-dependent DNA helicase PIF1
MINKDTDSITKKALKELEESTKHIFLTGNAGTGKSTLLEYWRSQTKQNIAVLAPTGVAALNVKGQTIHSFFGFRPDITVQAIHRLYRNKGKKGLFKKLDAIVIDEISMVRADLLDCIDQFLRMHAKNENEAFGGVRMIFIGDLHQLPPVVTDKEKDIFTNYYKTPYFFSSNVFEEIDLKFIELKKIHRQTDEEFIEILAAMRENQVSESQLDKLNSRFDPQFETPSNKFFITLTTTNKTALKINEHHLSRLFNERYTYEGKAEGNFQEKYLPTMPKLELKVGAQIMLVANDKNGRWVNGSLGKILSINKKNDKEESDKIIVELSDGKEVSVEPHTWEMFKLNYNPASDKLQSESAGSYTQYPLALAWAITIHKSQGKTFENVIIDFGWGTFAHGQSYVALSRCTSLKGIVLTKPFAKEFIIIDKHIHSFLNTFKYLTNTDQDSDSQQEAIFSIVTKAIEDNTILTFVDQKNTRRTVKPMELIQEEAVLVGHCFAEDEVFEFNLNKISELRELEGIS